MRDTLYSHSSIDCKIVYRLYQGWHMEEMPALACLAFAHMWRDRLLPCCHATRPRVLSMATCGSCPSPLVQVRPAACLYPSSPFVFKRWCVLRCTTNPWRQGNQSSRIFQSSAALCKLQSQEVVFYL